MGNSLTKLKAALHAGKEEEVLHFLKKSGAFDTTSSLGYEHWENTGLHYMCLHAMDRSIDELIKKCGKQSRQKLMPQPGKKNVEQETSIHMVCKRSSKPASREVTLRLLLPLVDKEAVNAKDKKGNTALHLAARADLVKSASSPPPFFFFF